MTLFDDSAPRPTVRVLGQPLDTLSVGDLETYIDDLEAEIARVRETLDGRQSHLSAAEALFRPTSG